LRRSFVSDPRRSRNRTSRLPTRARASSARALPAAARASTSSGQQTGSPGKPGAGEAGGVLANQIPGGETMPQRWETAIWPPSECEARRRPAKIGALRQRR